MSAKPSYPEGLMHPETFAGLQQKVRDCLEMMGDAEGFFLKNDVFTIRFNDAQEESDMLEPKTISQGLGCYRMYFSAKTGSHIDTTHLISAFITRMIKMSEHHALGLKDAEDVMLLGCSDLGSLNKGLDLLLEELKQEAPEAAKTHHFR